MKSDTSLLIVQHHPSPGRPLLHVKLIHDPQQRLVPAQRLDLHPHLEFKILQHCTSVVQRAGLVPHMIDHRFLELDVLGVLAEILCSEAVSQSSGIASLSGAG